MITELDVPYLDTTAAALRFSPVAVPGADLDDLVLDVLELGSAGRRLRLQLLGASHRAVLTVDGAELTETVACPACGGSGGPLPGTHEEAVGGLRYRFASQVRTVCPADLAALAARLRAAAVGPDRLAGVFPGSPDALTVLQGRADAPVPGADGIRTAQWRTWHLYPGTGEVVRTRSAVIW
ncbi:MAG: DUF2617 family protein [Actinomycetota bacterium]|nr:DUF2617 family protein [Actinomycetota bacterium]